MKVEVSEDKSTMQKVVKIDHRSMMDPNYAVMIHQVVVEKISSRIAEEYLAKNSADIISQIDPEVITNLVKVTIAKKVQEDHDRLMSRIDPLARSIPQLNKQHNEQMQAILKQS